MKKFLIAIALVLFGLVFLLPFASSNPDGLERVTESLGQGEKIPFWEGFMTDYSISFIGDSYASTLIAGIVGTVIVLAAGLVVGKVICPNKKHISIDSN